MGLPHLDRADRGRSAHKIPALTCALGIKLNGQLELTHGFARQKIAKKEPSVDIKNQNRAMVQRRKGSRLRIVPLCVAETTAVCRGAVIIAGLPPQPVANAV